MPIQLHDHPTLPARIAHGLRPARQVHLPGPHGHELFADYVPYVKTSDTRSMLSYKRGGIRACVRGMRNVEQEPDVLGRRVIHNMSELRKIVARLVQMIMHAQPDVSLPA